MARRSSNHAEWGQVRFVRTRRRFERAVEDGELDEYFTGETGAASRPTGRIPVRFGTSRLAAYSAAGSGPDEELSIPIRVAEADLSASVLVERRLAPAARSSAPAAMAALGEALHQPAHTSKPAALPAARRSERSLAGAVCVRGIVEGFMAGVGAALLVLVAIRFLF